ncbi:MAG: DinB family protein [Acidobacteriota bacterium]
MTMTEWFLAELESEAAKSRRVLEQAPAGKREFKPHDRSMPFGYLSDLVANIPSWVGYAITMDELDIAPKDGSSRRPVPLNTSAELVAALDKAVAQAREALQKTNDAHLATPWRLLAGGHVAMEQPRSQVIRDTFLHSAHHRGQMTVYLRLLESKVPSVYGPTADDKSFG